MITLTCRTSYNQTDSEYSRAEQVWTVSLNNVPLVQYSTLQYLDPQLVASAFATTLLSAVRPTLEAAQAVLTYREGTAPYSAAEAALQASIAQLYDILAKEGN